MAIRVMETASLEQPAYAVQPRAIALLAFAHSTDAPPTPNGENHRGQAAVEGSAREDR